jgi:precorrin-6A/cobalt-precorrin-6A reductase
MSGQQSFGMKILLLGGIAESKIIAQRLIEQGHSLIYSIVGLVRQPDLKCEYHIGGFSSEHQTGAEGLASYCRDHEIKLLLDITHPCAAGISANAVMAAQTTGLDCMRYTRPGWRPDNYENWHDYSDWVDLIPKINGYSRPFFTLGASIVEHLYRRPQHQCWILRSAREIPGDEGIITINAIGPFDYEDELLLMQQYNVDVLISKNSGSNQLAAKLDVALSLDIPVYVQRRPTLAHLDKCFDRVDRLLAEIVILNAIGS